MPFNWNDYLTLAEDLSKRADEAAKRTSVSRAYYFIFNLASVRAEKNCGQKQGGNSHDWCWNKYLYTMDPTNKCHQVGVDGGRLKQMRVKADYDAADIPKLNDYVQAALRRAKDLKRDLDNLPAHHPKYP